MSLYTNTNKIYIIYIRIIFYFYKLCVFEFPKKKKNNFTCALNVQVWIIMSIYDIVYRHFAGIGLYYIAYKNIKQEKQYNLYKYKQYE